LCAGGYVWAKDQASACYRHPSRFFEETAINSPTATQAFVDPRNIAPTVGSPTRVELAVPLKALVSQINYNLFDLEVTAQQSQFAYLQAKDLADSVDGLLRTHDVALWNGTDTSLSTPTTLQYFGVIGQIVAGGNVTTVTTSELIVDTIKKHDRADGFETRRTRCGPTAIYSNPVLLDLIDREMKTDYNVVLNTVEITGGFPGEGTEHAGWRSAADSRLDNSIYGDSRNWNSGTAGVHRDRGPDRVSLAERSESESVQAWTAKCVDSANGGGEVWRACGEGGEFRTLPSKHTKVGNNKLPVCRWPIASPTRSGRGWRAAVNH